MYAHSWHLANGRTLSIRQQVEGKRTKETPDGAGEEFEDIPAEVHRTLPILDPHLALRREAAVGPGQQVVDDRRLARGLSQKLGGLPYGQDLVHSRAMICASTTKPRATRRRFGSL